MSVSPSLYSPIWAAMARMLSDAAEVAPMGRLKKRLLGASILAARASVQTTPLCPSIDSIESILRAFTREAVGPAQAHCFAALAMIPALRSSASSSLSRPR